MTANAESVPMIPYEFPLREGVRARLRLPEDLTAEEAERLCAVIRSLAFPSGLDTHDTDTKGEQP